MLSSIKNIIFDLGGVVIDLDRQRCIDSFARIGFTQAAELISCYHPSGLLDSFERGHISLDELCDTIRTDYGVTASNSEICSAYSDFLLGIPLEKLRLIESLKERGFKIYALSNINEAVMPCVRRLFEGDGKTMDFYFDKKYLSFEMKCAKPDIEIYQMVIADSGIVPEQTLFIDDSTANIEVGAQLGLQVYLAEAFEDYSHLFAITSL